jgi:tetratricopeptide (TPR) repeat protein
MMQLLDQIEDLLEEQEYADAWTRLEAASELPLSPDEQAQALFWRSNWYSYQGRYADAESPIREAIDTAIDPQWQRICKRHLASLLVSLTRYKEALALCDAALESIDPTCEQYPDFEYWRASAYYGQGRMVEAAQAYRDCIRLWGELSGESFGVHISLVDIAARDGDWSTAWAHVRKAQAIYRLCSASADDWAATWAGQLDGWKELVDGWVDYLMCVAPLPH